MDINEIKRLLTKTQTEILDLWRSLWHWLQAKRIKRKGSRNV